MAAPTQSVIDTRSHQMFPLLEWAETSACVALVKSAPMVQARRWQKSAKGVLHAGLAAIGTEPGVRLT